ncbi:MAG: DUF4442 domain-containing protein [Gammaproteobacteria bacterium]|nr:DUF4442 domain-containing protein [Gammaproteobacteria bacterium]MDH5630720.1 DUF4442 domain-containing protein [Gammaproteobacteria bacterium]
MKNQLAKLIDKLNKKPQWLRKRLLNFAIGSTVKFVGTAGVSMDEMTQSRVVASLKNRKKVQNHIKTVHAAATSLLAETASGMVVGMNIPDDKLPLLKNMSIDYLKRSQGAIKAVANITDDQVNQMHTHEKGDVCIAVLVTDEQEQQIVDCKMTWAWIPKR